MTNNNGMTVVTPTGTDALPPRRVRKDAAAGWLQAATRMALATDPDTRWQWFVVLVHLENELRWTRDQSCGKC